MRITCVASFLALWSFFVVHNKASAQAPTGGPDPFGYTWATNAATNNPAVYSWQDISGTGTEVTGLLDDNVVGPFSMPAFTFYWNTFSQFYIGSNGYISFGNPVNLTAGYYDLNTVGIPSFNSTFNNSNNVIGALLTDLTFLDSQRQPISTARVHYQQVGSVLVVQFSSVPHWNNNAAGRSGSNTFQIQLNAADSTIHFLYQRCTGPVSSIFTLHNQGGFNGPISGLGLNPLNGVTTLTNQAIVFRPLRGNSNRFMNLSIPWITDEHGESKAFLKGSASSIRTKVRNNGTGALAAGQKVFLTISDSNWVTVRRDSLTISKVMPRGFDTTISFPAFPTNVAPGNYSVVVTSPLVGDGYNFDNRRRTRFTVLDSTATGEVMLSYGSLNHRHYITGILDKTCSTFVLPFSPTELRTIDAGVWQANAAFYGSIPGIGFSYDSIATVTVAIHEGTSMPALSAQPLASFTFRRLDTTISDPNMKVVSTGQTRYPPDTAAIYHHYGLRYTLPTPVRLNGPRVFVVTTYSGGSRDTYWNGILLDTLRPPTRRIYVFEQNQWQYVSWRESYQSSYVLGLKTIRGLTNQPLMSVLPDFMEPPYPNPATDLVRVPLRLRNAGNVTMRLISAAGNTVRTADLGTMPAGNTEFSLDLAGLPSGLYHCQVMTAEGAMSRKIQVR